MQAEFYADRAGEWRWRVKTPSGEIVAASTEGFTTHAESLDDYDRVLSLGIREAKPWLYGWIGFFTGILATIISILIFMG
jgi:uncharacterized protein YegP (UPF0339 family)